MSGSRVTLGAASRASSSRPSLNRRRTKLSLDVFSSSRRTRYAMPGTSSPTGAYTRRRKPSRRTAACTVGAMP